MKLTKTTSPLSVLMLIFLTLIFFQACKKTKSELGAILVKATGNKIYKQIDEQTLAEKFRAALNARTATFSNPQFTKAIYESTSYQPILLFKFLPDSGLLKAARTISQAGNHGLSPESFQAEKLEVLSQKIYSPSVKTVEEAYQTLIDLELTASSAITDYSNALQYGIVSPRKIFAQFYTKVERPDSASFKRPFETAELNAFLDSIQPKGENYKALQTALIQKVAAPGHSAEETKRILSVNLERLRWKTGKIEDKYVWVNIPAFQLEVMEQGKTALAMKVCVGEGRNTGAQTSLSQYDENDLKKDRPFNRETPQLNSLIHSVQVNPVWNIPQSIATNEITKYAAQDRYYLNNKNIEVFYQGKKVEDPETIDFSDPSTGKKYTFKQRPGAENSLGKIKFLFDNQSSVYLHDTPAKDAFKLAVRAVSHGCVRVEKPLELARALFGSSEKFAKIDAGMQSKNPKAENISLDKRVPVYLCYYTCWKDPSGKLLFANDIYGQDAVLYTHLNKG